MTALLRYSARFDTPQHDKDGDDDVNRNTALVMSDSDSTNANKV